MTLSNGSLDRGFAGLIPQTGEEVRRALSGGLLSLDANVLLNFYRYSPNAQSALLEVLRAVGDRVWVSHQAAREFWRNRCRAIDDRNKATEQVRKMLQDNELKTLQGLELWAKQTAIPAEIKDRVRDRLKSGFSDSVELIDAETGQAGRVTYDAATDSVVIMLRELLDGKVGPPLSVDEHQNAVAEASRRVKDQIPPGYKDASKENGTGPDGATGDYLVWHQSILEAKNRDLPLAIVTGDEKEDWWWKHRNAFMGPRSELIDEFANQSPQGLHLIRPVQLIEHASILDIEVNAEAASDVARGSVTTEAPRWSAEAVRELLRRLDAEGAVQADVIRFAASQGGIIDREKIYEIGGYDSDRMLRGFTRPSARITRDLQNDGLVDEGVEPMLTPIYQDVTAVRFEIPLDVVELLAADAGNDSASID
ncbi:PIN-like domain-containing protein [Amycolatopsis sp. H20-H5]|uniref:PIN-like domain-containing protein n=1 Tax=Amycolatopsis sp. H20-H5 TaxID=3046309 RepID=UPI002DBDE1DE|nr:PIN-like domain-containing protein [Amycolatopsis sp. H20-H5]MEC3978198.1 PIN-like domain-containing protein [Amycolatopsis sp. H20-H5]